MNGMSVEANIVVREKADALLVPAEALAGAAVLRVDGDRARRVPVTSGIPRHAHGGGDVRRVGGRAHRLAAADVKDGDRIRVQGGGSGG